MSCTIVLHIGKPCTCIRLLVQGRIWETIGSGHMTKRNHGNRSLLWSSRTAWLQVWNFRETQKTFLNKEKTIFFRYSRVWFVLGALVEGTHGWANLGKEMKRMHHAVKYLFENNFVVGYSRKRNGNQPEALVFPLPLACAMSSSTFFKVSVLWGFHLWNERGV